MMLCELWCFILYYAGLGEIDSTQFTGGPIVPGPDNRFVWSSWWNENLQGKPKYSTTSSTTNPLLLDLGFNPGRRRE
jgi:hypothetical protein